MAAYTKVNLKTDVEDMAASRGVTEMEGRFARGALELEQSGLTYFRVGPDFRLPFGHTHSEQEEIYVVTSGRLRMKVEDDVVELGPWDALRVPPNVWRGMEGGPEGAELLAFGAPNTENKDAELAPGWWSD